MKRRRVLLLLSVLCVFSIILGACGSKKPVNVEGTTWLLDGGKNENGTEVSAEDLAALGLADYKMEFKKDGVVTISIAGVSGDGTWTQSGNKVTMVYGEGDGEMNIEATIDGDRMTFVSLGQTIYMKKQ